MDEKNKFEVTAAPVVFSTERPLPYNPLNRPEISYKKPVIFLVLFLLGIVLLSFLPNVFPVKRWVVIVCYIVIYLALILKKAAIWLVHLYQNKASDETRLRCVFEPSCSEYMTMAIEKYGALIGIIKGIIRLFRCHPPNGGKDFP
jgi:putative membrane protein insertion efficiency factor